MAISQLAFRSAFALAFRQLPGLHAALKTPAAFQPRLLPAVVIPGAFAIFSNLQGLISSLWDSILLAVPKKRSSYSKKRSRQMAGKGLKDLINLNHCSSCGRIKRMHILCPHCVANIKDMWAGRLTEPMNTNKDKFGEEKSMGLTTATAATTAKPK